MYSVYQHWDPLKVCIVGKSYEPEFYSFIKNARVRKVLERIAIETEEDYQSLIQVLKNFNVEIWRPNVTSDYNFYKVSDRILPPPMTPRDYSIMLGKDFFFYPSTKKIIKQMWDQWKGADWPKDPPPFSSLKSLPKFIQDELSNFLRIDINASELYFDNLIPNHASLHEDKIIKFTWGQILDRIAEKNHIFHNVPECFNQFSAATTTRIGRDIFVGNENYDETRDEDLENFKKFYPQYKWHLVRTGGHSDATFCPVVPGLIVSLKDIKNYEKTFPDWEVIYLPNQSWAKVSPFLKLKYKNAGKWWVPGEELNDDFTNFVESWLNHWVGFVEETVFDVNMLVIDEKNVLCNNHNEQVFKIFEKYNITPHVVNFRHRYFWDGGLHCITSDVHREGTMNDYFPNRN